MTPIQCDTSRKKVRRQYQVEDPHWARVYNHATSGTSEGGAASFLLMFANCANTGANHSSAIFADFRALPLLKWLRGTPLGNVSDWPRRRYTKHGFRAIDDNEFLARTIVSHRCGMKPLLRPPSAWQPA